MSYIPFGRRSVVAIVDKGQFPFNNSGNPTAVFHPSDLVLPQGQFEVQKAAIIGGPVNAGFAVFIDTYQIDSGQLDQKGNAAFYKGSDGEWIVTNQSEIYVYFTGGTVLPRVNLWLSYDPLLRVNSAVLGRQGSTY
jgi:hypothetical protein